MTGFLMQLSIMSLQATLAIGVVLIIRLLFHKLHISKKYTMLLWMIPFICLIFPWKISSPIGIWDSAPIEYDYESIGNQLLGQGNVVGGVDADMTPNVGTGVGSDSSVGGDSSEDTDTNVGIDSGVEGDVSADVGQNGNADVNVGTQLLIAIFTILPIVWGAVVMALLFYSMVSYWKLHGKLKYHVQIRDNIYWVDDIPVPMVIGLFRYKIYIPSGIEKAHLDYVIAHEETHIRRKDVLVKLTAYLITCVHWFNPAVWIAYNLMIKDMEMACDEETILRLGIDKKNDYSEALLQLASGKRNVFAAPLAFGEGSTKGRIQNILNFKKAGKILSIAAIFVGIVVAAAFLTKAVPSDNKEEASNSNGIELTLQMVQGAIGSNTIGELEFSSYENNQRKGDYALYEFVQGETDYYLTAYYEFVTGKLDNVILVKKDTLETLCLYYEGRVVTQRADSVDTFFQNSNLESSWRSWIGVNPAWIVWIETNLHSDLSAWFGDYSGEALHRIPGENVDAHTGCREDIVYYQTQEENLQHIINTMVDDMLSPLMSPAVGYSCKIQNYRLEEHTLYQINENAWLVEYINGYYQFDGRDGGLDTEAVQRIFGQAEDGLCAFARDTQDEKSSYLLIRDGDVYRLQLLKKMIEE